MLWQEFGVPAPDLDITDIIRMGYILQRGAEKRKDAGAGDDGTGWITIGEYE